jgi:putative transposase
VRYDWLSHHLFDALEDIQDFATHWLWTYNHDRPNMALDGITPKKAGLDHLASTFNVR